MNPFNTPPMSDDEARELFAPLAKTTPARNPEIAAQKRAAFLDELEHLPAPHALRPASRSFLVSLFSFWNPMRKEHKMVPLLTSILVAFVLALGGAGATAYAAQDSLPGEPLYPVKTLTEDIALALTFNDDARFQRMLHLSELRTMEILALQEAGLEIPASAGEQATHTLEMAYQYAAQLSPEGQAQAAIRLQQALQVQERLLQDQKESPSPVLNQVRQMVIERLRLLQAGNGNLDPTMNMLEQQPRDRTNEDPGEPVFNGEGPNNNVNPDSPSGKPEEVPGTPGQGKPEDVPGEPGLGKPEDVPGEPGLGKPEDVPGEPGLGKPEDTPETPGQGIPEEIPGEPGEGQPEEPIGDPALGQPEETPGEPGAGIPEQTPAKP